MQSDGRMRPDEAARYLGLSEKTLSNLRSMGRGPSYVKMGLIFYFEVDLDTWIQECRRSLS